MTGFDIFGLMLVIAAYIGSTGLILLGIIYIVSLIKKKAELSIIIIMITITATMGIICLSIPTYGLITFFGGV